MCRTTSIFTSLACSVGLVVLAAGCADTYQADEEFDRGSEASEAQVVAVSQAALVDSQQFGFAWVNTDGNVDPTSAWESAGYPVLSYRAAAGVYVATFRGLGRSIPHVVASGTNNVRCNVASNSVHPTITPNAARVEVRCYTPAGVLADSAFYVTASGIITTTITDGAFVEYDGVNQSVISTYNSASQQNTVSRTSTGVYQVTLPQQTMSTQVTKIGSDGVCAVGSNYAGPGSQTVRCFDRNGPVDSVFAIQTGSNLSWDHPSGYPRNNVYGSTLFGGYGPSGTTSTSPAVGWTRVMNANVDGWVNARRNCTYANEFYYLTPVNNGSTAGYCKMDANFATRTAMYWDVKCYSMNGSPLNLGSYLRGFQTQAYFPDTPSAPAHCDGW